MISSRQERIVALAREGMARAAIAERVGVTVSTVWNVLSQARKAGIDCGVRHTSKGTPAGPGQLALQFSEAELEALEAMARGQNAPVADVVAAIVREVLADDGAPAPPAIAPPSLPAPDVDALVRAILVAYGTLEFSNKDIAQILGVSPEWVSGVVETWHNERKAA